MNRKIQTLVSINRRLFVNVCVCWLCLCMYTLCTHAFEYTCLQWNTHALSAEIFFIRRLFGFVYEKGNLYNRKQKRRRKENHKQSKQWQAAFLENKQAKDGMLWHAQSTTFSVRLCIMKVD